MPFKDYFSEGADVYLAARPRYPKALFEFIAGQAPALNCAWDCATGNGQAAVALAEHFAKVHATDASEEQINHAIPDLHVSYSVQPAEYTNFVAGIFDAVTVAQALHWFDLDAFYREAKRVMKPSGVLAAWGYAWQRVTPEIDAIVQRTILTPLEPYWPQENALLWSGYKSIPFPFEPIATPPFELKVEWDLAQFLGYLGTWSAFRRCLAERGNAFARAAQAEIESAWGDPTERRQVSMDFYLRMGRHQ